jgi:hypothetical protein
MDIRPSYPDSYVAFSYDTAQRLSYFAMLRIFFSGGTPKLLCDAAHLFLRRDAQATLRCCASFSQAGRPSYFAMLRIFFSGGMPKLLFFYFIELFDK